MLGEIVAVNNPIHTMQQYVQPAAGLATAYSGALVHDGTFKATEIADLLLRSEEYMPYQMICWLTGTHDFPRLASRCGIQDKVLKQHYLKLALMLMCCMRGNVCLYQGEELGLDEAEIAYEDMQDPYGIALYPKSKTRDGCRTPMPWHHTQKHAGFSDADKLWLPVWAVHLESAVTLQENDEASFLSFYKAALQFRKESKILRYGSVEDIGLHGNILSFARNLEGHKLYCIFNFSGECCEMLNDFEGLDLVFSNQRYDNKSIPAYFSGIFKDDV